MIKVIMSLCLLLTWQGSGAATFYVEHAFGWHWYHEINVKPHPAKPGSLPPADPLVELHQLQQRVKRAKARAILHPSIAHIQRYIQLQQQITQQAATFSQLWAHTLRLFPAYDVRVTQPPQQAARLVYLDNQRKANTHAITHLGKQYGLFFFFRSTCPYCHRFAPIVKRFADRYHLTLIPISIDGAGLPDFPHPKRDNGQAQRFHVSVVPALLAVDPAAQRAIPLTYGFQSLDELTRQVADIAKLIADTSASGMTYAPT